MSELRDLRRAIGLKQEEFAALLGVPMETLRTWDSGRRPLPTQILERAKKVVAERASCAAKMVASARTDSLCSPPCLSSAASTPTQPLGVIKGMTTAPVAMSLPLTMHI